jgi:hypothetical protein
MAKLLGQVHWDGKNEKVVTTYQVVQIEPNEKIQFFTKDSRSFVVQTKDTRLVKRFGLKKVKNADGLNDLYQVNKGLPLGRVGQPKLPVGGAAGKGLKCGTLDKQGHFVAWPSGWGSDD